MKYLNYLFIAVILMSVNVSANTIRLATFNVSMEADNYLPQGAEPSGNELFEQLKTGDHPQIRNIAEIIQRVRPDILLLNEFDYTEQNSKGIQAFIANYLNVSQHNQQAINYPYVFVAPVNTGVASGVDLNLDGEDTENEEDAFGYGKYPGQYGMVLLSRYPIDTEKARTFQHFLWKDLPGHSLDSIKTEQGDFWFSANTRRILRLSSKSHWDVPIHIGDQPLHILASHPTPPVFDGPENRNGYRNRDELMFWSHYLAGSDALIDDAGTKGGLRGQRFAIMGDLNASTEKGDAVVDGIRALTEHPKIHQHPIPSSNGGLLNSPDDADSRTHTAAWQMRADYVLVSKWGNDITDSGVFWPVPESELSRLVEDRQASSDHRLVWVDIRLK